MTIITPLPTVKSVDNADLNEAVTKLNLKNEINAYITRLCKNVIHLLELGTIVTERTSLIEKCLIFYNLLLDIKFAGNYIITHLAMPCTAGNFIFWNMFHIYITISML